MGAALLVFGLTTLSSADVINFSDYNSKLGQNQYTDQGIDRTYTIDGTQLSLSDDVWINFNIASRITEDTILKIDVKNVKTSELLGLQFINSFDAPKQNGGQAFVFAGTQKTFGIRDYQTIGNDWNTFEIQVGEYFTGDFAGIVFFSDNDKTGSTGQGMFGNIELNPVPAPTTFSLLGIGLLGLAGFTRRKQL